MGSSASLSAARVVNSARVLVIAHRGYRQLAPENTLAAFEMALAAGADLVELDYHHSQDEIPVVIHDATLDRTTNAATKWQQRDILVSTRTAVALEELDAGSWFDSRYSGLRIPRLASALDLIQTRVPTLIERKSGDAATCVTLLREKGLSDAVVVQSFDWRFVRDCHRLAPDLVLGALGPPASRGGRKLSKPERVLDAAWLDEIEQSGARIVVWNDQISKEAVDLAHRRGLKVWVYTINSVEEAQPLLVSGIDGIISDNPALMRKALALGATP